MLWSYRPFMQNIFDFSLWKNQSSLCWFCLFVCRAFRRNGFLNLRRQSCIAVFSEILNGELRFFEGVEHACIRLIALNNRDFLFVLLAESRWIKWWLVIWIIWRVTLNTFHPVRKIFKLMGHLKPWNSYVRLWSLFGVLLRGLLDKHFIANFQEVLDDLHWIAVRSLCPVGGVLRGRREVSRFTLLQQSLICRDTNLVGASCWILYAPGSHFIELGLVLLHVLLREFFSIFLEAIQAMCGNFP